jgi:hypothetical protein
MACVASLGPAMVSVDTMMCPHQCGMSPTSSGASFLRPPTRFPHELHHAPPKKGVNPFFLTKSQVVAHRTPTERRLWEIRFR